MAKSTPKKPKKPNKATPATNQTHTFQVMPLAQGDLVMYAFVAPSEVLRSICTVSRREEDSGKGYQRHLKESRLRQIARYVDDRRGAIPNNIIVDFFHEGVVVDEAKRTITVPSTEPVAWVIDGQHRLFGFDFAHTQYPLLVTAFVRLDLKKEVDMFVTINTEQKRLPSSLALDLLGITGTEEDINRRCRELVAKLNEDEESPWYGQVNMTGEGTGHIALVNYVRKVKPLVSHLGVLHNYTFLQQYGALVNFWSAIKAVYADQWGKSLLTKTLGFGALMNLFPTVFTKTMAMKNGEFTTAAVISTFTLIRDIKFDADTLGSGTGNKAEMAAAEDLAEELNRAISATTATGSPGELKL
jgi:DGQHR domain-containing protein